MILQRKKWLIVIITALFGVFILAACGGQENPSPSEGDHTPQQNEGANESGTDTRTLVDGMGNKVEVPAQPERIIAAIWKTILSPLALHRWPSGVLTMGKSIQGYLQFALKDVPPIPYDLPFEAVQSFNPDLIIMDSASLVEGGRPL